MAAKVPFESLIMGIAAAWTGADTGIVCGTAIASAAMGAFVSLLKPGMDGSALQALTRSAEN
jgi:hypothetical protein